MILIAIGANLATSQGVPPLETCRRAVASLNLIGGLRIVRLSRWYKSAALPPSAQNSYVNAVVRLTVERGIEIDPAVLLERLMQIEAEHGRVRSIPKAARTLDLDIVAMGEMVRTKPDPILPHPRAHERAFVLLPVRDVAPGWVHPFLGRSVEDLLTTLPPQDICAL